MSKKVIRSKSKSANQPTKTLPIGKGWTPSQRQHIGHKEL